MPFRGEEVDCVICSNALNYMAVDAVLPELVRVMKPGAVGFIGLQNELYPVLDLLRDLQQRNSTAALDRINRIVTNAASRLGITGLNKLYRYWNDSEMAAMCGHVGLQLTARGIELPEEYGFLCRIPVLWGYRLRKPLRSEGEPMPGPEAADVAALVRAGAVEMAWQAVRQSPELAGALPNMHALLKQLAVRDGMDAEAVLRVAEELRLPIPDWARSDVLGSLPLMRVKDWAGLAEFYAGRATRSVTERLCAAWLQARSTGQPLAEDALGNGYLGIICRIGTAVMREDNAALHRSVAALFRHLGTRRHVLQLLTATEDPARANVPSSEDSWVATERQKWQPLLAEAYPT